MFGKPESKDVQSRETKLADKELTEAKERLDLAEAEFALATRNYIAFQKKVDYAESAGLQPPAYLLRQLEQAAIQAAAADEARTQAFHEVDQAASRKQAALRRSV